MQQPTRLISTPFAQEGEKTEIQNVTGEFDNSATYQLGFPPLTMQSIRLGGKPPKGTDFNGVLFDITENISFLCKGGRYQYNSGLSTLISGYPEGSNLLLDDNVTEVVSTVAGNQNNPNTDMTGWTFKPNRTTAEYVLDASGETQQQVNYNGGSKWHSRVGGYKLNERVVLANGNVVKSTINGNANNPNASMTGWAYSSLTPSNNLSDVANKATARTNLDVYSKTETNSIAGTPNATETVAGKAKIATTAIAQAGTNDTDFITALKLANTRQSVWVNKTGMLFGTTYMNTALYEKEISFLSAMVSGLVLTAKVTFKNLTTNIETIVYFGSVSNWTGGIAPSANFTVPPNTSFKIEIVRTDNLSTVVTIAVNQWSERYYV